MQGAGGPVSAALARLVAGGALLKDAAQQQAAAVLDRMARDLDANPAPQGLFGLFRSRPQPVRGAYLVGSVGRGKTMLMDLFFSQRDPATARRVHFHEFMDEMHESIRAFRASERGEDADPVAAVTAPLVRSLRVLCLDEFHVDDITNAMLLGRLFDQLWAGGIVLVATSNTRPEQLYHNGLNRDLVLPFIARLEQETELVVLDGPTDFRRLKFSDREMFHFGPGADDAMDRLWLTLTGGDPGAPASLVSLGRTIPVPRAALGAARFPASRLLDAPLGARDFLRLAHAYDLLMIDRVPRFAADRSDAARRFILLVDALYDRGVKLAASFDAPLDELGGDARVGNDFRRALSRLLEMQSRDYLEAPRRPGAPAPAAADGPAS